MRRYSTNQKGAVSIEFVMAFVVFFMLFYGMVSLFFPLLLSATYEELSSEALREAVIVRSLPTPRNINSEQRQAHIDGAIAQAVNSVVESSWLPEKWRQHCPGYSSYIKVSSQVISTCIGHKKPSSILPQITLLGYEIVKLPETIQGESVISF